jgi:hypothetical protein
MYNEVAIKWIKSITRDGGNDWAYMEYNVGDIFHLRFPDNARWYPTNYGKAIPNELMVLFQTLNGEAGNPEGTYVTHLITPVDRIVEMDDSPHHPYKRYVCVVGRTNPAYRVNPEEWSFYKPNRGQICDIRRVERRVRPDHTPQQKQTFIWNMFNDIDINLDEMVAGLQTMLMTDEEGVEEGAERVFLKLHKTKERNPGIIAQAKSRAREEGRFFCEVCEFNFETRFPVLGNGFIECHHKLPIASGGIRQTRVDHLALVCSNCHRMLHRKMNGAYLSVDQLKDMVIERRLI